ncbi:MAG: BrnT family toxin [Candidatus Latescibacterota bacterium]|nr:MAG: BrnT family toxin [Candidatus Latescibacterota bacterium]
MADIRFEWDPDKDKRNKRKHGVSFEEAITVFVDEHALLIPDPEHSESEDRFLLLGLSSVLRMLVVCHCYRESTEVIRIISARPANAKERRVYRRRWSQ